MIGLPVPGYAPPNLPIQLGGGIPGLSNNPLQLLLALIQQNQNGQNQARQANESRYNDILKLFGDNRQRDLSSLDTFGQSLISDANRTYTDKRNNLITDLADRGLSGSTKRIAVEDATQREKDAAVNRVKDMISQERRSSDLGFTDRAAGVMERRSDPYPQNTDVGGLISQLVGAFPGALGGGSQGPQPHYYNGPGANGTAPATAPSAVDDVNSQRAAKKSSQDASASEAARQNAMTALTSAMHKGGVEGEDATRQALDYLQRNGWASQNPNTGVPTVNFGRVPQPSYDQPASSTTNTGGSGGPQYRTPLWQRDPTFASRLQQMGLHPWDTSSASASQPGAYTVQGPQTPTNTPPSGGLSPFGQLAGLFNMAGFAGQAASPYLSQLRSYVGY